MPKRKLLFVQFSDIHFGQERDGTIYIHNDVRREIIADCSELAQPNALGPADGVLITGDIAFGGRPSEYRSAEQWLDAITKAAGCSRLSVRVIPGNHDIDLNQIGFFAKTAHEKMRAAQAHEVDGLLEGMCKDGEANNPVFGKFAAYREFAEQYGCDFESLGFPAWKRIDWFDASNGLCFVGLNSVQVSDRQDSKGQMILGNRQYAIPRGNNLEGPDLEGKNVEYVVMIHHPLHWLKDHHQAEHYLRRSRVIMVGHEHRLELRKITEDDGKEHVEIYAGSTNPQEGGGVYQYRYNWIEFELQNDPRGNSLAVTIYPRVWEPSRTEFVADRNRLNGDQSRTFLLSCPYLKSDVSIPVAMAELSVAASEEAEKVLESSCMSQDSAENFARLRFFFWRYLDWPDRLKVLVELDILPSALSQPIPQTMERMALEIAQKQGKLQEVWTSVMEFVPEEEREENPFTHREG
jgi:GTPase-associated adaptor domain/Calcineurin-like phosphoesterase